MYVSVRCHTAPPVPEPPSFDGRLTCGRLGLFRESCALRGRPTPHNTKFVGRAVTERAHKTPGRRPPECSARASASRNARARSIGMSAVALIASVQTSVAAALARGVSLDSIESRLAACCSDLNMMNGAKGNLLVTTAGDPTRSAPRRRPEPRLSPVATGSPSSAAAAAASPGAVPPKQSSPGRRQLLPPSGLTPRVGGDGGGSPDPARSPSTASKSKLAPIARADSLTPSTDLPSASPALSISASTPALGATLTRTSSRSGRRGASGRIETAASLLVESHSLRDEVMAVTYDRCPLDVYTHRLDEFLRLGKQRSQLEKDQKGLGNPTITLPLNLPDFEDELRARERRKLQLTRVE